VDRYLAMADKPYVFVSYARTDREPVRQVVDELHKIGIDTWTDLENLSPGEDWEKSIYDAIRKTLAMVVFISPQLGKREWILHEVELALRQKVKILPVLLRDTPIHELPPFLARIQWLDMGRFNPASAPKETAAEIARFLNRMDRGSTEAEVPIKHDQLARALAAEARGQTDQKDPPSTPPNSIFVVHGHDEGFLQDVVNFLQRLGIVPLVMKDIGEAATSLIDKFFEAGTTVRFAIVLLSGDDLGASRIQYEEPDVGSHSLQFRSRQNVILELGYFYGKLGWENVFVLEKAPPRIYPNYERPSDLSGVVWDHYDNSVRWQGKLHKRLSDHGFSVLAAAELPNPVI
jgi:predicted nucleotide-binding protein